MQSTYELTYNTMRKQYSKRTLALYNKLESNLQQGLSTSALEKQLPEILVTRAYIGLQEVQNVTAYINSFK